MTRGFSLVAWCATATALVGAGAIAQTRQNPEVAAITDPAQLPDQEIGRHFSI